MTPKMHILDLEAHCLKVVSCPSQPVINGDVNTVCPPPAPCHEEFLQGVGGACFVPTALQSSEISWVPVRTRGIKCGEWRERRAGSCSISSGGQIGGFGGGWSQKSERSKPVRNSALQLESCPSVPRGCDSAYKNLVVMLSTSPRPFADGSHLVFRSLVRKHPSGRWG